MATQPSVRPDEESVFFPDGRGDRPLVRGTVARGQLRTDAHLFTGRRTKEFVRADAALLFASGPNVLNSLTLAGIEHVRALQGAEYVDEFPFPVTQEVLQHGHDRFMIYCVVCHDALGTGHGKIVERGYTQPPSYHSERLRQVAVGHFFAVMTDGYGSMPEYKQQIPPRDRWAIAAYIRALQLSQHFPEQDMPADMRKEWRQAQATKPTEKERP